MCEAKIYAPYNIDGPCLIFICMNFPSDFSVRHRPDASLLFLLVAALFFQSRLLVPVTTVSRRLVSLVSFFVFELFMSVNVRQFSASAFNFLQMWLLFVLVHWTGLIYFHVSESVLQLLNLPILQFPWFTNPQTCLCGSKRLDFLKLNNGFGFVQIYFFMLLSRYMNIIKALVHGTFLFVKFIWLNFFNDQFNVKCKKKGSGDRQW